MFLAVRPLRFLQLLVAFHVSIAVLYTTYMLLVSPLLACLLMLLGQPFLGPSIWQPSFRLLTRPSKSPGIGAQTLIMPSYAHPFGGQHLEPIVLWNSTHAMKDLDLGHDNFISMSEELFLTKAFANSMRPSKIVPFYYRATGGFDREDITITTLITSNRFQAFARLVERYQGTTCSWRHS